MQRRVNLPRFFLSHLHRMQPSIEARLLCFSLCLLVHFTKPPASLGVIGTVRQVSTFKATVSYGTVDAVVRDKEGGLVTDLTLDDFQLWESGRLQKIAAISGPKNIAARFTQDAAGNETQVLQPPHANEQTGEMY